MIITRFSAFLRRISMLLNCDFLAISISNFFKVTVLFMINFVYYYLRFIKLSTVLMFHCFWMNSLTILFAP